MRLAACFPLLLAAAACSPATAPEEAPVAVQPNNATYGTDANLAASTPDAILRYADHPRGFAELRLPQGKGPFPLAVIYHGGCWKTGIASQAYMAPLATRWQQQGIATLNVDYREVGDGGGWPGSFEDWQASAALIDEVVRRYPVKRGWVTLVGHSAGALPALWLARMTGLEGPAGSRLPVPVAGAIVLDGPGDVGDERPPQSVPERYRAISPSVIPPRFERVLFVQAKLPAPSAATQAALASEGAAVTVRENPQASHFAIITPGNPVYQANEAAMLAVLRAGQ